MTTNDDHDELSLDDNPGLEHEQATPEGESMTAAGSTIDDPRGGDDVVTLEDDPGLEHDEATEAGRMMTGSGSTGRDAKDARSMPATGGGEPGALRSHGALPGGG